MAWQLIIREGLSLSAMARLGELALALAGIPQAVRITCGQTDWLRLFTPAQQQLLTSMRGPTTERGRMLWCGTGQTAPRYPEEATWYVLAEDGCALPDHVADRYEQVIALVGGAAGKPHVTELPGCTDAPASPLAGGTLLVVAQGRQQDAAFVADLREAGVQDILVLNPYAPGACHFLERHALYSRCIAAASAEGSADDYFLQEAQAYQLTVFRGETAATVAHSLSAQRRAPLPPAAMPWPQVAQRCLALANRLAVPSGAQIQRLLAKMQHATHIPTVLLKTPARPGDEDAMVGFSVASDTIVTGVAHQATDRFNLRWLLNAPSEVSRRRLYHYPYQRNVGNLGDEMDFAHLPGALRQHHVDLLCTTQGYTHGLSAARAAWATRAVPVVGMLHAVHASALASETLLQMLDGPSLPCDAWISPTTCGVEAHRRLMTAAAAHLAQTAAHVPQFAGNYHVIPYGIDRAPFAALHAGACRQALDLPQNVPIALSLGRFLRHEKADLMPLLLAWESVVRIHPQALLLLAGSYDRGTYARQLKAVCAEHGLENRVLFFENVSTRDKLLLYGAADFFVTVSDNLQETYGLTVIEAMAAGLPVVAAGWNGYQETVQHGETGFVVPTHMVRTRDDEALLQRIAEGIMGAGHRDLHETVVVDVQDLARHMRTLIDLPQLRQRMGSAARTRCANLYDQDRQAERLCQLLVTLMQQAKGVPWESPSPHPFFDRVTERFAHYTSHGYLDDHHTVAMTRYGRDAAVRRRILQQAGWATPEFCRFTDALCEHLSGSEEPCTIKTVLDTLPGDRYRHMLNVARLLKYGILRRAGPM